MILFDITAQCSASAFLIAAVGPVRVYLGDHWSSDVLGGYLLGGAWLGLAYRLYRFLKARAVLSH